MNKKMDLQTTVSQHAYTFDLSTTPVLEQIKVVRIVTDTFRKDVDGDVVLVDTKSRYQVSNTFPWYLSVDCSDAELPKIIEAIQYVIDNPPQ